MRATRVTVGQRSVDCCRRKGRRVHRLLLLVATVAVVVATSTCCAKEHEAGARKHLPLKLDLDVMQRFAASTSLLRSLPDPSDFGIEHIVAFEETRQFVYCDGTAGQSVNEADADHDRPSSRAKPWLRRRVFILKPTLLVVDDQVSLAGANRVDWAVASSGPIGIVGQGVGGSLKHGRFYCRALLPQSSAWTIAEHDVRQKLALHDLSQPGSQDGVRLRALHVVNFAPHPERPVLDSQAECRQRQGRLEVIAKEGGADESRGVELWFPHGTVSSKVRIFDSEGEEGIPRRLLPAGILPLGLAGLEMRLQWDLPYRVSGLATWDTGRPSSQLKRLVDSGTLKPCRTIELGCGTGNDAVYLAQQGFDVTAVDISPTALSLAQQKAHAAGVRARWQLADVLRPPADGTFDLVYDRGCYHTVRRHHAKEYVAAVARLSRPGGRILILAGNANADSYWRFHGPPRVREAEIRADFARGFRLLHLREFRFDPTPPERRGALAWSVLLTREVERSSQLPTQGGLSSE